MKRKPLNFTAKYVKSDRDVRSDLIAELAGCFAPELVAAVEEMPFALADARRLCEVDVDPAEVARQREIEALEHRLAMLKGAA